MAASRTSSLSPRYRQVRPSSTAGITAMVHVLSVYSPKVTVPVGESPPVSVAVSVRVETATHRRRRRTRLGGHPRRCRIHGDHLMCTAATGDRVVVLVAVVGGQPVVGSDR